MCGIAGIISSDISLVTKDNLKRMTDSISHRGLDGEGFWLHSNNMIGFGHRRLAIIDLSNMGTQPMHYLGRYTIVYNGEIYNYIEIKKFLQQNGYHFNSQSDTEVILAAYDYWKEDCVNEFDGMFAFAIYDRVEQSLYAARDRFGEKPFYYYKDEDTLVFASEMKALWALGLKKTVNEKMLLNYLALGYVQSGINKNETFFENIVSLPPAHYLKLSVTDKRVFVKRYWYLNKEVTSGLSPAGAIEKFTELFDASIKKRLRSDVPIGTSLSGGLDSSSIVANIHQSYISGHADHEPASFSAVFPGFNKDESPFINAVVKKFDLQNFTTAPTADDLIKDLEAICYYQEEPFHSSSIYAQYKVFKLASQHNIKVLLDGQGADETLAGYPRYIHWYLQQLLADLKFSTATKEKNALLKNNVPFDWSAKNLLATYFPAHVAIMLEKRAYRKIIHQPDLDKNFVDSFRGREWGGIHKPIVTGLNDILYFNVTQFGLEELLRFADRNSMAHGREVRLPFLNHELVEFLFSLPPKFKIHNGWTKWLLRKAMDKKLPDEIVWRTDKIGYEPPQQKWMQHLQLQDYIHEAKKKLVSKGILKQSSLNKKIIPLPAHDADNYDWRYLCAAQLF